MSGRLGPSTILYTHAVWGLGFVKIKLHSRGLRAYALTLPLLGFKCTWYEIKSRDVNQKGKDFIFIFCNKPNMEGPIMPSTGLHASLHMAMCVHSICPCFYPSARSACTHKVVLPAAAWGGGVHVHVLK